MYSAISLSSQRDSSPLSSIMLVGLSSLLIALFAKISIPLPFSPVPLVLQSHLILLLSMLLGSQRAIAMVSLFLLQGALGFPVFAGGAGGLAILFGPRGGYLVGYLIASFIVGYLAEKNTNTSSLRPFIIMLIGNLTIFFFGVSYLSSFIGIAQALMIGFLPFILGDLLKLIFAAKLFGIVRQHSGS